MDDIKAQLIEVAQTLIQKLGYNGFSYRDIAAIVGIRNASIHYHFPTKADLGAAVAVSYRERFMERLASAKEDETDTYNLLSFYTSLFKEALDQDNRMCLCGMLSAEVSSLPDLVAVEAKRFLEENLDWLSRQFALHANNADGRLSEGPETEAALYMASLQGALILAKGLGDTGVFDRIAEAALGRYR